MDTTYIVCLRIWFLVTRNLLLLSSMYKKWIKNSFFKTSKQHMDRLVTIIHMLLRDGAFVLRRPQRRNEW